jgi:pyrimidine deaminase RibD-like protein
VSQALRNAILLLLDDRHRNDPRHTVDDSYISRALDVDIGDVRRQLDILEDQGFTHAANTFGGHSAWISPRGMLAAETLRPLEGSTMPVADREPGRSAILRHLDTHAQTGSSAFVTEERLAQALHLPIAEVRRQLDMLEALGYTTTANTHQGRRARISPHGMLALEHQEASSPEAEFVRGCMEQAVELARRCTPEDERPAPKVAAVLAERRAVLGTAYRGELGPGEHAEFTLLRKKLEDRLVAGATLYTTLEPCTRRNLPKRPCVEHIIERRIAKVYIGTLDPNPVVRGRGLLRLRQAGIEVELFSPALMSQLEELNREFFHAFPLDMPDPSSQPAQRRAEIDFGAKTELSFAGLLAAYSSSDAAEPSASDLHLYLDEFRIVNHDEYPTTADRLWVEVDGHAPNEVLETTWRAEKATIPPRTARKFTLQYQARYRPAATRQLVLKVDLIGIGVVSAPIPDWILLKHGL